MATINTLAATTALAADFARQDDGELGTMFAAYKVAAKIPTDKERNAVVDAAVASMNYDLTDKVQATAAENRKSRGRVFFGASRFFTLSLDTFPADLRGEFIFAVGNNVTVNCDQLKKALKAARAKALETLGEGAIVSDLGQVGGENYAWATTLNKAADNAQAAPMLTIRGVSEFFVSRAKPRFDKRIAAEQAEQAKVEAAAALKLAAEQAASDRQSSVPAPATPAPATPAPATPAPATPAPATPAPATPAPATPAPATPAPATPAPSATVPHAPGRPVVSPTDRTALSALVPLPLVAAYQGIASPNDRSAQFKALVLRMLDDLSGKDVQAIVAEAIRAHDRKVKDNAPKAEPKAAPKAAPVADPVALGIALGGE